MTPSLTDKTSTPAKDWRRHTDPPSLWVAVVIGSLSLHLIAFWLIRSYQSSLLWRSQSKASIPIEIVEISSQPKSRVKPRAKVKPVASQPKSVSSKPLSTNQKLQPKNLSKPVVTTKPNPTTPDKNTVAIAQQRQQELVAQRQRQLAEQQQRELIQQQQRQQELIAQRQRQLAEQRQQELAQQQQRQQELAQQQQRQQELAQQRQSELAEQRQPETTGNTNNEELPSQPLDAGGGSLIASLVGEPQQDIDRHTHPAKIKPSNQPFTKGLEYVKYIEKASGQPVEFTVTLTISEKGKLEYVAVVDKNISESEKSYYEDFVVNQVLNNWEFEPAYDNDPNDPKPSTLIVRIRLQPLP